jgi:hypothetical protein
VALRVDDGERQAVSENDRDALGLLDVRRFANAYAVTADGQGASRRSKHTLEPPAIVLINGCSGQRFGFPDDIESGCGMAREARLDLLPRAERGEGTDAGSWEVPNKYKRKRAPIGEAS